jgi:hypothetical protein
MTRVLKLLPSDFLTNKPRSLSYFYRSEQNHKWHWEPITERDLGRLLRECSYLKTLKLLANPKMPNNSFFKTSKHLI